MADVTTPDPPHLDVAGYVLGTLAPGELAAFESHLGACSRCQADLGDLSPLADLLAAAGPPGALPGETGLAPDLEDRTFAAIAAAAAAEGPGAAGGSDVGAAGRAVGGPAGGVVGAPAEAAATAPVVPIARGRAARNRDQARGQGRRWNRLGPLAAAAAIVVAVATGAFLAGRTANPEPVARVELAAADGGPARAVAVVHKVPAGLEIDMAATDLAPSPEGTMYTCWLVGPGDTLDHPNRVSVGSFAVPAGTSRIEVHWTTAGDLARYPTLGVTLEPVNGNPSHQGPKVLASL